MPASPHAFTRHASLPHLELRTTTQASDSYQTHTHAEYSLGCIDAGAAVYSHGTQTVALRPGMAVMMEPGLAHACNPSPQLAWSYRMLYVDAQWVHQSFLPFDAQAVPQQLALARHHSDDATIFGALTELLDSLAGTPDPLQVDEQLLHFLEQHVLIPRGLEPESSFHHEGVARVRDLLHARVEQPLALAELAQASGLDGFALIRKFKLAYGQTPHAYQIDLRLNLAKQLLKQGAALADVAHQLGFADQAHFQRQFKKRHATTPKNYQGDPQRPTSSRG
jgi:AraC-like DNA-binding protein